MDESENLLLDGIKTITHKAGLTINLVNAYCEQNLNSSTDIETIQSALSSLCLNLNQIDSLVGKIQNEEFV